MTWVAYADESMHSRSGMKVYILAAAVLNADDCADVRLAVSQLGKRGRGFHWRDADAPERRKAVDVVAGLPALHLVVVGAPLDPRRQERARRHCLRRLLFELESAGVDRLWLEARTPILNARDMHAINVFSMQGVIRSSPHVGHIRPVDEPLLLIPDIVAGSVNAAAGGDDSFVASLNSLISRCDIKLD